MDCSDKLTEMPGMVLPHTLFVTTHTAWFVMSTRFPAHYTGLFPPGKRWFSEGNDMSGRTDTPGSAP